MITKRSVKYRYSKFKKHWKNYVLQSVMATVLIYLLLSILHLQHLVNVASIGASAFIVFAMPKSITAKEKNLVGGHISGIIVGALLAILLASCKVTAIRLVIMALSVGITMFIMVVVDVEHPPACGTALGIAADGFSSELALAVIVSSLLLAAAHYFLKPYMKTLV